MDRSGTYPRRGSDEQKKQRLEILVRGPYVSNLNETDLLVRLYVRRRKKYFKIFLQFQGFFPGKADSTTLLGLDCTINPQNLIKIGGAIFEKIEICFSYVNYP